MEQRQTQPSVTDYLYKKAVLAGTPISGTFELTPLCNMDCKMCYVRLSPRQQEALGPLSTARQWLALAEQCRQAGMLYLLLTGGEPFTHPQFRQILEGLHRMGFLISINSNGTLISSQTLQWLRQTPPVRMNISLYGACDETYSRLCGDPKGFSKATEAIRLLREADIPVKLNISLTPHNAADLPAMMAFAKAQQLPVQLATYMFPPLRKDPAMAGRNQRFTPAQAAWYAACGDYLQMGREEFLCNTSALVCPGDPQEDCAGVGEGVRCRAGKCSFWVAWDGRLLPCGMVPVEDAPNVFSQPFVQAWEQLRGATARIRLPAACTDCPLKETCRPCAAMVLTESGCFDRVPVYRCQMAKELYAQRSELARRLTAEEMNSEVIL